MFLEPVFFRKKETNILDGLGLVLLICLVCKEVSAKFVSYILKGYRRKSEKNNEREGERGGERELLIFTL